MRPGRRGTASRPRPPRPPRQRNPRNLQRPRSGTVGTAGPGTDVRAPSREAACACVVRAAKVEGDDRIPPPLPPSLCGDGSGTAGVGYNVAHPVSRAAPFVGPACWPGSLSKGVEPDEGGPSEGVAGPFGGRILFDTATPPRATALHPLNGTCLHRGGAVGGGGGGDALRMHKMRWEKGK